MLSRLQRLRITAQHREDWYRAMGKTAADGLPQAEVLASLERDFARTDHPLAPLLRVLLARLRGIVPRPGAPAQRTVGSELTGLVPEGEASLIQAGIESGRIAEGFQNAAEYVASQGKLRNAVFAAMAKPIGYLVGVLVLLWFFSVKILPAFDKGKPRDVWPASAQLLGTIADHVVLITGVTLGLSIAFAAGIAYLAPNWTGPRRTWADQHVFPFGLIAQINGASFLTSLAGYISSGIPIVSGVENIAKGSSRYMASQCATVISMTREGRRFEECLVALPIVDRRYHWLINVYGLASDSALAYRTIAEQMTESTLKFIKNLFDRVVSNVLLIALGGMLLWIYLSMFAVADPSTKKRAALDPEFTIAAESFTTTRS